MFKFFKAKKLYEDEGQGTEQPANDERVQPNLKPPKLNPAQQREGGFSRAGSLEPKNQRAYANWTFTSCRNASLESFLGFSNGLLTAVLIIGILYFYMDYIHWGSYGPDIPKRDSGTIVYPIVGIIFIIFIFRGGGFFRSPNRKLDIVFRPDTLKINGVEYDRTRHECSFIIERHPEAEKEKFQDKGYGSHRRRFMYRETYCIYLMHEYRRHLIAQVRGKEGADKIYNDICAKLMGTARSHF